jgi:sulfatase-like protein
MTDDGEGLTVDRPAPPAPLGRALRDYAHLAVLWAVAIAQPLFEVIKGGELFVFAAWKPVEIVVWALSLVVVPPALLLLVELAAGRINERLRSVVHLLFVGGLVAVFAAYLIKRNEPEAMSSARGGALTTLGVAALGIVLASAYARLRPVREFLTVLSPLPLLFAGLFLFDSPVRNFVFPDEAQARHVAPAKRTPIVVIVLDETPTASIVDAEGRLATHSYPSLARLARDATWFPNATSPHDHTEGANPALLRGRHTPLGTPPAYAAMPDNLFSLLRDSHRISAFEQDTRLCPPDVCSQSAARPFPQRVTKVLPALGRLSASLFLPNRVVVELPSFRPFSSHPAGEEWEQLIRAIRPGGRPGLYYIYGDYLHRPWTHFPDGTEFPEQSLDDLVQDVLPGVKPIPGPLALGFATEVHDQWIDQPAATSNMRQMHLAQLAYGDHLLGRVLARLRKTGIYDRSMIVVTADHGVAFRPDTSRRQLTQENMAEVLRVPLFVKRPFQRRGRIDRAWVRTMDIFPTIAQVLGLRVPWPIEGRSLFSGERRPSEFTVHSGFKEKPFHFTASAFQLNFQRTLRRYAAVFGNHPRSVGLFELGPHPELLGRRAADLPLSRSRSRLLIDDLGALRSVDLEADCIPARVAGTFTETAGDRPRGVAISLNGRIVATRSIYRADGRAKFGALMPKAAFRSGRNELQVYEVRSAAAGTRLERLELSQTAGKIRCAS